MESVTLTHFLVISRAEAFLPRLAASNDDLMHRAALDPASVDIEHLPNTDAAHIELVSAPPSSSLAHLHDTFTKNLGLGVFEQRSHEQPGSDPDSDSGSDASSEPNSEDYSDSDDSSADDSDSDSSADSPSDDHSHTQTQTQTHTKPDIKSS